MAKQTDNVPLPVEPPPQPKKKKKRSDANLLSRYLHHRQQGKEHYETADLFLNELINRGLVGKRIVDERTGDSYDLVDNFADKNKVFKPCGINRFDLKLVKGTRKLAEDVE